ncbi:MAG: PIN domain-containing protein, partial [Candidatus Bathyarchaeia archaeon]
LHPRPRLSRARKLKNLLIDLSAERRIALNPTILYETYHTLVYGQKWVPSEAFKRLKMLLRHPYIEFFSQTKKTCAIGLSLANQHKLGGRDALIIANFLTNKVPVIYIHDQELLSLKGISWKNRYITCHDPLIER